TDEGVEGFGEVCPLGSAYLPGHARGACAALEEVAPSVVGLDATNLGEIGHAMDRALMGHGYAKSALDMACWDVFGKAVGRPVADANGGWRLQDAVVAARLLEPLERVFLEQPCATFEECLIVRQRTTLPMVLDEVIVDVHSLLRAYEARAMEAINLKVSKVGG